MHREIGALRKSLPGAFHPPGNRNRWGICQQMCVSLGVRGADRLGWLPEGWSWWGPYQVFFQPLCLFSGPWGPEVLVCKPFFSWYHLEGFKKCWSLNLPQESIEMALVIWMFERPLDDCNSNRIWALLAWINSPHIPDGSSGAFFPCRGSFWWPVRPRQMRLGFRPWLLAWLCF